METKPQSNESPGIKLARKYGLSDEQIEAMQGMEDMISRASIWRFRKRPPERITESVRNYAQTFIAYTQLFTETLSDRESLPGFNMEYAKSIMITARKDLRIAIRLDDEELLTESLRNVKMIIDMSKDPDAATEEMMSTRNSTPPPQPPDSNT